MFEIVAQVLRTNSHFKSYFSFSAHRQHNLSTRNHYLSGSVSSFFFEKSNFEVAFGLYEKSNVKLFVDLQRENLNIVQLQADIFQNQN